MAKKRKARKHIFKISDLPTDYDFVLVGIQTTQNLYKLAFDFNKIFHLDFKLAQDIKLIRKDKSVAFENYATGENAIGQKMRLLNNEILIPIAHPNTLFDTHEAYYLFPELPAVNYLLLIQKDENLNFEILQERFKPSYPVRFIKVDMKKCATVFPVFPV